MLLMVLPGLHRFQAAAEKAVKPAQAKLLPGNAASHVIAAQVLRIQLLLRLSRWLGSGSTPTWPSRQRNMHMRTTPI